MTGTPSNDDRSEPPPSPDVSPDENNDKKGHADKHPNGTDVGSSAQHGNEASMGEVVGDGAGSGTTH